MTPPAWDLLRDRRILPIPVAGIRVTRWRLHGAADDESGEGTMARSMWRGAIQFGLVTIPVRLYLATESQGDLVQHAPRELPEPDPDEDLLPASTTR